MGGLGDEAKGAFDQVAGRLTGDREQEIKGEARQIAGSLKDKAEAMKDALDDKTTDVLNAAKKRLDSHSES